MIGTEDLVSLNITDDERICSQTDSLDVDQEVDDLSMSEEFVQSLLIMSEELVKYFSVNCVHKELLEGIKIFVDAIEENQTLMQYEIVSESSSEMMEKLNELNRQLMLEFSKFFHQCRPHITLIQELDLKDYLKFLNSLCSKQDSNNLRYPLILNNP